jgi:3-dehydroquinate synthase
MPPAPTNAILVGGARPYCVHVEAGALARLEASVAGRRAFVLTDANVERLHAWRLGALGAAPRLVLESGEAQKSLATLGEVLERMAAEELGRDGVLVAFGGGVIGDLGGLAAALYARGIDYVACPTTLLAQADAAIGGKTAVNLRAGKNLAGAFHPPLAVLADSDVLATLPERELRSGLGELLKASLIEGGAFWQHLQHQGSALALAQSHELARAVHAAAALKARIVTADEREAGPREVLNLGHTFGHALEQVLGPGVIAHGIAVAMGIGLALEASRRLGLLKDPGLPERVGRSARVLGLPADARGLGLGGRELELQEAVRRDKKRRSGRIRLVLPIQAGDVRPGVEVDEAFLLKLWADGL